MHALYELRCLTYDLETLKNRLVDALCVRASGVLGERMCSARN